MNPTRQETAPEAYPNLDPIDQAIPGAGANHESVSAETEAARVSAIRYALGIHIRGTPSQSTAVAE